MRKNNFTIKFKKKKKWKKEEKKYLFFLRYGIESFFRIYLVYRLKYFYLILFKIGKNNWNFLFWKRMYIFDNKFYILDVNRIKDIFVDIFN